MASSLELPIELYTLISIFALESTPTYFHDRASITSLNRKTRQVAIETPEFWNKIRITNKVASHEIGRLQLERADPEAPLEIYFWSDGRSSSAEEESTLEFFAQIQTRIRKLESLQWDPDLVLGGMWKVMESYPMPLLESLRARAADNDDSVYLLSLKSKNPLRYLNLEGFRFLSRIEYHFKELRKLAITTRDYYPSPMYLDEVLQQAPLLEELYIRHQFSVVSPGNTLSLPNLRKLVLYDYEGEYLERTLDRLDAPKLQHIQFPYLSSAKEQTRILTPAFPDIQRLAIHEPSALQWLEREPSRGWLVMAEFPNITHLEIELGSARIPLMLDSDHSDLLPYSWQQLTHITAWKHPTATAEDLVDGMQDLKNFMMGMNDAHEGSPLQMLVIVMDEGMRQNVLEKDPECFKALEEEVELLLLRSEREVVHFRNVPSF
ncbi:hypothetical protein FRC04_011200 [Tulasnella sp. 424]|nr:hypothetical protein FRC04_011200 [Tulasnella sp. 424]KAG8971734.1 hypothetical protein FRC05_010801 [Tulasnella sp. 425]